VTFPNRIERNRTLFGTLLLTEGQWLGTLLKERALESAMVTIQAVCTIEGHLGSLQSLAYRLVDLVSRDAYAAGRRALPGALRPTAQPCVLRID
jgi:hypothetical protein